MNQNIKNFIKAKEEEFDEKYLSYIQEISIGQYDENGVNIGFLPSEKVIKNFISQSILEYNEKIKRDLLQDLDHEECAKCYIERKLTNLTQDTNPKE